MGRLRIRSAIQRFDFATLNIKGTVKRRKKVCPRFGWKLRFRDFHRLKDGTCQGWRRECMAAYKREVYARTRKKADGTFLSKKWNRVVVKNDSSVRFHWSENDLSLLRRHFISQIPPHWRWRRCLVYLSELWNVSRTRLD